MESYAVKNTAQTTAAARLTVAAREGSPSTSRQTARTSNGVRTSCPTWTISHRSTTGVIVAAALGIAVVSALWWLYFDVAAIFARRRLMQARGLELHRLALQSYTYLHLPMVAGIVLFALGLETTLHHVGDALETVPAVALCGGAALYLVGHIAFLFRTTGRVFRRRTLGAVLLLALVPAAVAIPALAALALVSAVCSLVVAYEAIRHRAARVQIRHPELAA
jgi:low temperature requirement protein LtrA